MTVRDAFESFITHCESERLNAPQTVLKYRDCFHSWLLPFFGHRELLELNRVDILVFRDQLVRAKLSVSRQYSLLIALKLFLKFCRVVLQVKCLDPAEIQLPNKGKPHVEVLSTEELKKVFDQIKIYTFSGIRLRALIELILGTGVRISEALSLDRKPFDEERREIEIVGKGNKRRTIFLTERASFWVKRYLKFRVDTNPALFITTGDTPTRWVRECISKFFIKLRKEAAIKTKFTPHILRHTYCTNMLEKGADITFIKELAGHEDIETTARYYLGVDKRMLRNAVDKFVRYDLD